MHAMVVWGHMLSREKSEKMVQCGTFLVYILIVFCLKTFLKIIILYKKIVIISTFFKTSWN